MLRNFRSYLNESNTINEKLITFGKVAYPKYNQIVILAGGAGCLPKGTEFFTENGWKNIEDYKDGDKVLEYSLDGTTKFVTPSDYINLPVDKFTNIKNRRVDFTTSDTHRHLLINEKTGNYEVKRTNEIVTKHNSLSRGNKSKLVNVFSYSGKGLNLTDDEIRLSVSIFADGHFLPRVAKNRCRVRFTKNRKIERFIELLNNNSIQYKEYVEGKYTVFEFDYKNSEKEFESYWYNANSHQLSIICDEVIKWDGSIVERDGRCDAKSYSTCSRKSIDFIQFAFASIGISTSIYTDIRENRKPCYELNISYSKGLGISKNPKSNSTTEMKEVDMGDRMYCFTVDTGFFIVRQNDRIYVTGNSGKGFVLKNLLGIEGIVFDVDRVKELSLMSTKIASRFKEITNVDIKTLDLSNEDDVSLLHTVLADEMDVISNYKLSRTNAIRNIEYKDRKPNLIFDITLKNMKQLHKVIDTIKPLGYKPENIHIVWVVNDVEVAKQQNRERTRRVKEPILMDTHRGASKTAKEILNMGSKLQTLVDGDIWYSFNKRGVDTSIKKSKFGGSFIEDSNYIKVKEKYKSIDKSKVTDEIISKIQSYVPIDTF